MTVTDAIKLLSNRRVVRSEPGRGVFVARPADEDPVGKVSSTERVVALVGAYVPSSELLVRRGVSVMMHHQAILDGIWSASRETSTHLLLLSNTRDQFQFDQIRSQNFDGLILLGGVPREQLVAIRRSGVAAIHANASLIGGPLNFIDYDHPAMIRQMVRHFTQAGHTRIAALMLVHPTIAHEQLPWMEMTFVQALREHGLDYNAGPYWRADPAQAASEFEKQAEFITHQLMDLPEPPTAIFCHGAEVARSAEAALTRRGLTIGRDISVIAAQIWSDRTPFSAFVHPHVELGRMLVQHLLKTIDRPDHFVQELIPIPFTDRGTVARRSGPGPI